MILIEKEELLKALERKYGDLNDECGCSVYTDNGKYVWLSIKGIVDVINDCMEWED